MMRALLRLLDTTKRFNSELRSIFNSTNNGSLELRVKEHSMVTISAKQPLYTHITTVELYMRQDSHRIKLYGTLVFVNHEGTQIISNQRLHTPHNNTSGITERFSHHSNTEHPPTHFYTALITLPHPFHTIALLTTLLHTTNHTSTHCNTS